MTRSASATARSTARRLLASVMIRPLWIWSTHRSRSRLRSKSRTSASMPCAIHAAFHPTLPAPITTTRAGRTPGAPPSSTPRPPWARSRKCEPTWGAIRPGDLAHRREEGKRAGVELHRLVGDADDTVLEQRVGDLGVRREVEIGEEHEPGPEVGELFGLRLLDLQHEAGARPHVGGVRHQLRAGAAVRGVGERRPAPAPSSTSTVTPWTVSSCTPSGVIATRYSPLLRSRGTPTTRGVVIPAR